MSYAETLLADGERILYRTRQHPLAPLVEARYGVGLVVVAIVLFFVGGLVPAGGFSGDVRYGLGWLTLAILVVGLAWIAKVYLAWHAQDYVVTDRRVVKIEGILNKHAADSSLNQINDAVIEQHLLGRLLGYGDLSIMTAAEVMVDCYAMLDHVVTFKRNMLNSKHDLELSFIRAASPTPPLRATVPAAAAAAPATGANGPTLGVGARTAEAPYQASRPAAPAPAPARPRMTPEEVTSTLSSLADLRDRGAITPEEYEEKKAQLLDRL